MLVARSGSSRVRPPGSGELSAEAADAACVDVVGWIPSHCAFGSRTGVPSSGEVGSAASFSGWPERHGSRTTTGDEEMSLLSLHWTVWDDLGGWLGRPARVDNEGGLVWAHPATRRSYSAAAPESETRLPLCSSVRESRWGRRIALATRSSGRSDAFPSALQRSRAARSAGRPCAMRCAVQVCPL
jgi:hypothetical protein